MYIRISIEYTVFINTVLNEFLTSTTAPSSGNINNIEFKRVKKGGETRSVSADETGHIGNEFVNNYKMPN